MNHPINFRELDDAGSSQAPTGVQLDHRFTRRINPFLITTGVEPLWGNLSRNGFRCVDGWDRYNRCILRDRERADPPTQEIRRPKGTCRHR